MTAVTSTPKTLVDPKDYPTLTPEAVESMIQQVESVRQRVAVQVGRITALADVLHGEQAPPSDSAVDPPSPHSFARLAAEVADLSVAVDLLGVQIKRL